MQPGNWTRAFRNLCAVAAQMHRVAKARILHGLGDPIAISLLLFRRFRRWQQQVCRTRTAEGFGKRSGIAHISRERLSAFVHKALQSSRVAPNDAHLLALREKEIGDDRAGMAGRPQNHIHFIRNNGCTHRYYLLGLVKGASNAFGAIALSSAVTSGMCRRTWEGRSQIRPWSPRPVKRPNAL